MWKSWKVTNAKKPLGPDPSPAMHPASYIPHSSWRKVVCAGTLPPQGLSCGVPFLTTLGVNPQHAHKQMGWESLDSAGQQWCGRESPNVWPWARLSLRTPQGLVSAEKRFTTPSWKVDEKVNLTPFSQHGLHSLEILEVLVFL